MLAYKDAPNWWYGIVLLLSFIIGLICIYTAKSTMPWLEPFSTSNCPENMVLTMNRWALIVAIAISYVSMVFFSAMYAITGFGKLLNLTSMQGDYTEIRKGFNISNLAQLVGAYMNPGLPVANMYFTLYVSSSAAQARRNKKNGHWSTFQKLSFLCYQWGCKLTITRATTL